MRQADKFLSLKHTDRILLIRAALLVVTMQLGIRALPFGCLRGLVNWAARPPVGLRSFRQVSPDRVAWAVNVASAYVPRADTCLPRALAGQVLLARYGFPAQLHIGIARGANGLVEGHAWVECAGQVVIGGNEIDIERYTQIAGLEGM